MRQSRQSQVHFAYQHLSGQIKDYIAYAQQNGYTFTLRIREGTKLSKPLQEALKELQDSGQIIIQEVKQSGEILSKKL